MDKPLKKTLYEQLGGRGAVEAAVDLFYEKVMADERINFLFEGVDIARQRAKQKAFMTYAFGGAPGYSGQSLRKAHEHLVQEKGLTDEHFDAVAENLKAALQELNVPAALIKEVLGIVGCTRDDVLGR